MESFRQELEVVYNQFGHQLFVYALAITGNGELAEDALHDAFCQAICRPRNLENAKAYMLKSVRHAAIDLVRKSHRTTQWTLEAVNQRHFDRQPVDDERADLFHKVLDTMGKLKEVEREIVMAHLVGDMTFQEIAEVRQQPLGTVTSYYHRAMQRLKGLLEKTHESL